MSRTVKAIERHMTMPVRLGLPVRSAEERTRRREVRLQNSERKLVAEWQRGAEILEHVQRKLHLAFARPQSPAVATLGH